LSIMKVNGKKKNRTEKKIGKEQGKTLNDTYECLGYESEEE